MLLRLYTPLQNWLLRRAKVIVGTTPVYVKESPFLENIQRKVTSIPIGIDEMKPIPERVAQIKERYAGKKIIFSLGRLVEYKGYEYLIQAARRLTDDYVILIGGRGPLQEYLQALIDELGVADRVKLLGFIEDDDLPDYFGACDLFCLSSILKTEAFGIVQIEAMSCGKPVIAMNIPESGVSWVNISSFSGINVKTHSSPPLSAAWRTYRIKHNKNLPERACQNRAARSMITSVMMEMPGSDEWFMRQAMKESRKALVKGEVPVGAIVVKDGRVIGRGWNQVETLKDATAHAEMIALTAAQEALGDWRLEGCTLYVTKEPCPMCAGAIVHCRPDRVVFGCPDAKTGAAGGWINLLDSNPPLNHKCEVRPGVLGDECLLHLQEFFRAARLAAKERKKLSARLSSPPDENGE